jgi:hypothetical protein
VIPDAGKFGDDKGKGRSETVARNQNGNRQVGWGSSCADREIEVILSRHSFRNYQAAVPDD